jgi:hypothetical protein
MSLARGTFGGTSLASQGGGIARAVRARRVWPIDPVVHDIATRATTTEQRTQHPRSRGAAIPSVMFADGEQGAWYDPSDIGTLWQDVGRTISVTGLGQPVGFVLDKSGNGNHLAQADAARRPVLDARSNLLTGTETLATQSVVIPASFAHTLSFFGTGTVTLSGASTDGPLVGTGATDRVSLTFTPTAATLTLTVTGTVTDAQLEQGSAATTYQRVTASDDYEDIGLPRSLSFDGVDDILVSTTQFPFSHQMALYLGYKNERQPSIAQQQVFTHASTRFDHVFGNFRIHEFETSLQTSFESGALSPASVPVVVRAGQATAPYGTMVNQGRNGTNSYSRDRTNLTFPLNARSLQVLSMGSNLFGKVFQLVLRYNASDGVIANFVMNSQFPGSISIPTPLSRQVDAYVAAKSGVP